MAGDRRLERRRTDGQIARPPKPTEKSVPGLYDTELGALIAAGHGKEFADRTLAAIRSMLGVSIPARIKGRASPGHAARVLASLRAAPLSCAD